MRPKVSVAAPAGCERLQAHRVASELPSLSRDLTKPGIMSLYNLTHLWIHQTLSTVFANAQATTKLPAGFSALWMETAAVRISCGLDPFCRQPDAADQLCRLLSCAPASYRRARSTMSVWTPRPLL